MFSIKMDQKEKLSKNEEIKKNHFLKLLLFAFYFVAFQQIFRLIFFARHEKLLGEKKQIKRQYISKSIFTARGKFRISLSINQSLTVV